MELKDKICLITGGSSGIGLQTAKLFSMNEARVIITASSDESFENTRSDYGNNFDVIQADVSKINDIDNLVKKVVAKYKKIDVLFISAGIAFFTPTSEATENFFDKHFNINVKGSFFTVSKFLPYMNPKASVILTSSVLSKKGLPGGAIHSATKASLISFVRNWTSEYDPNEVRFNVISPGPIDTPIHSKQGMSGKELKEYKAYITSLVPAKRFGNTTDVAELALFLASEKSSYICGSTIDIDGGFAQI